MNQPRLRNLLLGLAALLMLGHSLVPHDHHGANPPKFFLWELFSVDLGSDHLQHFAPTSCEAAPEEENQQQLPLVHGSTTSDLESTSADLGTPRPCNAQISALGFLSGWSRRPPPSELA